MTQPPSTAVTLGHNFEVLIPKTAPAYPIACDEWDHIKRKVGRLKSASKLLWILQNLGPLLLGAALSTFITIQVGGIDTASNPRALAWAWFWTGLPGISGVLCWVFAHYQSGQMDEQTEDVVEHMTLIEKRYPTTSSSAAPSGT